MGVDVKTKTIVGGDKTRPAIISAVLGFLPPSSVSDSKLYVVNNGTGDVSAVDTRVGAVCKIISSPGGADAAVAYNSANGLVYLVASTGSLNFIDPATDSFIGTPTLGIGTSPMTISISPELSRALIPNYSGNVTVINTTNNAVIASIITGALPVGSAFLPSLRKAYVVNNGSQSVSVIDLTQNAVINEILGMGGQPADIKIDTAANKAIVTKSDSFGIAIIDTVSDTVVASLSVPGAPQWVAVDSVAHRAYVSLAFPGGIAVVDTVANAILATFPLGSSPSHLGLNATRDRLYVADRGTNSVHVIDTTTRSILTSISVGIDPTDIAVVPIATGSSLCPALPPPPPPGPV
jgi:YVTN family beta-propeller protein